MRLIKWERKDSKEIWQAYRLENGFWRKEQCYSMLGQSHVYQFILAQQEPFQFVIMGLNMPYRNTFYYLMPEVHIMITPMYMFQYIGHFYRLPSGYSEEVAVSMDAPLHAQQKEVYCFLKAFYQCPTKEKAVDFYEQWQLVRALNNPIVDKLQMVMQLFEEEIFNYFVYQGMLCFQNEGL